MGGIKASGNCEAVDEMGSGVSGKSLAVLCGIARQAVRMRAPVCEYAHYSD